MLLAFTPFTAGDVCYRVMDQWEAEGEPYLVMVLPTLGREDRRAELERWKRSPAMRAGMARFCDVFAHVLAQQ